MKLIKILSAIYISNLQRSAPTMSNSARDVLGCVSTDQRGRRVRCIRQLPKKRK